MLRFFSLCLFFSSACSVNGFATSNADTETLDANQHVIMFEKGVDAFMAGNYEKCDDYWLPLARAGDMMATRNVALLYHKGLGVQKDLEEAELFYRLASNNGVTDAQTILGVLLIKGDEFERNIPDAIKYLTAASQAGEPIAAWNLGLLYENGVGIDKNLEKAMSFFQMAARGGHKPAIIRISGQPTDSYAPPQEIAKEIDIATQSDNQFDSRPEPVIPTVKTFSEKVIADKEHDKNHFSDQIHFNNDAQSDDPDVALKNDLGQHKNQQVGIDKELDPFGVTSSKTNRLNEPFNTDKFGSGSKLNKADEAYNNQKYSVAKEIWEDLLKDSQIDEAAYRLGLLYAHGKGVEQNLFKAYFYWKKGADAGGKKSSYILEDFRAGLDDKKLLEYEQKTM